MSLYSFPGGAGEFPVAGLVDVNGTLYGATGLGGDGTGCSPFYGCGVLFKLVPSGSGYAETVVYSFQGGEDGGEPEATLTAVKGRLYGSTIEGGGSGGPSGDGLGTIYEVSTSGKERVLHRFTGTPDGAVPSAPLVFFNGNLYGVTAGGGAGYGTVFELSASGESVIYRFQGKPDGASPNGLIAMNGALYGTTGGGGANGDGTVFELNQSSTERVIYSFRGGRKDGAYPHGGLLALHGSLYGVTSTGGTHGNSSYGGGTVFEVTTSGEERVLHSFDGSDGAGPSATLVALNGRLYGTTVYGGDSQDGTVFEVTTSGNERVLHSFDGTDGSEPYASLLVLNGSLYGTTRLGGDDMCVNGPSKSPCGTVFEVTP